MNVKIEIHSNNNYERKLGKLPSWNVPESTKKEIRDFIYKAKIGQVNEGKKLSDRTLSKYLSLLKHSLEIINKPTFKLTKKDIEDFDKQLTEENLKSCSGYRLCLQVFFKWKLGLDKSQKIAGWLDTNDKKKTPDYLSEVEIGKLFKNCKNPAERFLISVLFDSGARIEEFLNIRYEDIQMPEGNNAFVKIALKEEYSKTKGRTISLYWKNSLNSVKDYLDERIKEGVKSTEPVYNTHTYDAIRFFLGRLGQKILNKKISPHLFRHSSATYYASRLNRQELCYRYGWAFSSDMPDVYISRAGMENKELDEKFKATELEEIQKKFEIEKFRNNKEIEELRKNSVSKEDVMRMVEQALKKTAGQVNPKISPKLS